MVCDLQDKQYIDFSAFCRPDYIIPGPCQMQVYLNGDRLESDISVLFYERAWKTLDPRKKQETWHQGLCADFWSLAKGDVGAECCLGVAEPEYFADLAGI